MRLQETAERAGAGCGGGSAGGPLQRERAVAKLEARWLSSALGQRFCPWRRCGMRPRRVSCGEKGQERNRGGADEAGRGASWKQSLLLALFPAPAPGAGLQVGFLEPGVGVGAVQPQQGEPSCPVVDLGGRGASVSLPENWVAKGGGRIPGPVTAIRGGKALGDDSCLLRLQERRQTAFYVFTSLGD